MILGRSATLDRNVYLIDAEDVALVGIPQGVSGNCFVCFLAMDASNTPDRSIYDFAQHMIRHGCVYFCAWGPDCERVHDIIDEAVVGSSPPESVVQGIMTTWHSDELLADALFYFLCCTVPGQQFATCRSAVIVTTSDEAENLKIIAFGHLKDNGGYPLKAPPERRHRSSKAGRRKSPVGSPINCQCCILSLNVSFRTKRYSSFGLAG